ncbi:SMP-30/gluconolactonase/LRE family protein [Rhodococcus koreensis]
MTVHFETLASGLGFTEGPIWDRDGNAIVTSVERGTLYLVRPGEQPVTVAVTGGGANGLTEGADGSLYVSQNGGKKPAVRTPGITGGVQKIDRATGLVSWLSQDPISANDLCFGPDGYLYVTDPTRRPERNDGRIWKIDPTTGESELLCSLPWYPNGLGFGLEPDVLFVASTGDRRIVRLGLDGDRAHEDGTAIQMQRQNPDGFAFDAEGNLVIAGVSFEPSVPGSVQVWTPTGDLLDYLTPVEDGHVTNLAFDGNRLLLTASDTGRALVADWPTAGLPLYPFRKI